MQQTPAANTQETEELTALFPDVMVRVRVGRWGRTEILRVRPFSIRELLSRPGDPRSGLEIATGKSTRWLRRVHADDIATLTRIADKLNEFSPEKITKHTGTNKAGKPFSIGQLAALMVLSGHDENRIWDYPVKKFMHYAKEAVEIENRREAVRAVLAADGVAAAIAAAFSKEGAQVLREFRDALLKEAKPNG